MSINKCGQSLAFGERVGVRGNWTHAISTDSGALRLWSYAGIRQVLPGRQSRRPPCEPTDEANRWGYEFCQRGALEHSGRSCRTDGSGVTLRTCWSANPQVGFREMLVDCIRSHSPFPLNEHRRKAPTWGPPRIPECM